MIATGNATADLVLTVALIFAWACCIGLFFDALRKKGG